MDDADRELEQKTLEHAENLHKACAVLRDELLKFASGAGSEADRRKIAVAMLTLRSSNRDANLGTEKLRKRALEARESTVPPRIKLENYNYLANQLRKEIQACRAYAGTYQLDALMSEDEVLDPMEASSMSEHDKMMARLEAELAERKRLQSKVAEIGIKRRRLEVENSSTAKFLEELPTKVEAIAAAAKPVKDYFMSTRTGRATIGKMSSFSKVELEQVSKLPTPLFIIYREAAAYRDTFEDSMSVSIVSDKKDGNGVVGEDSVVRLHFREAIESSKSLELLFRFISELGIVTLECKSSILDTNGLCNLYPGDDGLESPNPGNAFSAESKELNSLWRGGLPFMFAQVVCGLRFPDKVERVHGRNDQNLFEEWTRAAHNAPLHARFGAVIIAIRARAKALRSVASQLESLQRGASPFTASAVGLPAEPRSKITPWKRTAKSNDPLSKEFAFEMSREKYVITVEVKLRVDYPYRHPEWQLACSDKHITDEDVRDIVDMLGNYAHDFLASAPEKPEHLLGNSVKRLQACLDAICETEAQSNGVGLSRLVGRVRWDRPFLGPLRQRPISFNDKNQMFEQTKPAKITPTDLERKEPEPANDDSTEPERKLAKPEPHPHDDDETLQAEVGDMEY